MDEHGVVGMPWMSTVDCTAANASTFLTKGITDKGHLRFYLKSGSMTANGVNLSLQGDAFWVSEGSFVDLAVTGFVFVIGSEFALQPTSQEAYHTTSFHTDRRTRSYLGDDAIAGSNHGENVHDSHINNGTTTARDLVFSKGPTTLDPPSISVLNCADESSVWYHSHPSGALYMLYAGEICFHTDVVACVHPGKYYGRTDW